MSLPCCLRTLTPASWPSGPEPSPGPWGEDRSKGVSQTEGTGEGGFCGQSALPARRLSGHPDCVLKDFFFFSVPPSVFLLPEDRVNSEAFSEREHLHDWQ